MLQTPPNPTPFQYGWWSFDLGKYRPCDGTYCFYPYESLPPIPEAQFSGKLEWLGALTQHIDQLMQAYRNAAGPRKGTRRHLQEVLDSAKQLGLTLPEAFVRLMASPDLQDRIPSCTACEFRLTNKIVPCPGSEEGYIIGFLNDQQDVLLWYLYLTPKGEECVLVSSYALDELADEKDEERSEAKRQSIINYTQVCAPSFEAFLYRFWLENTIWFTVNEAEDPDHPSTEEQRRYLAHYQAGEDTN